MNSLNFEVPTEFEASEFPKCLVLGGNAIEFTNEKELEFALDNRPWGNMTWVSCADLVSKWCPMADGVSDTGVIGGKSVKEVMDLEAGEEVFMEIEGGEIEQVHIRV
ncbi:hypothetical protein DVH24_003825 [Malus domestica]|uniref:Uncharacterized protein n=1 Tax=Malus domestica TaxID=3750 RepID=A0A498KCB6_MALDO|nr:hypothetical protein DVH24_003825 [Malus domestica]